jgi:hypothetical protein
MQNKEWAWLKQEQIFIRSNFLQNCIVQGVRDADYICAAGEKIHCFLEKFGSSRCTQTSLSGSHQEPVNSSFTFYYECTPQALTLILSSYLLHVYHFVSWGNET